jgi:hypothetical protein
MWVFYGDSDPMKEDAVGLCRFFAQSKTVSGGSAENQVQSMFARS